MDDSSDSDSKESVYSDDSDIKNQLSNIIPAPKPLLRRNNRENRLEYLKK